MKIRSALLVAFMIAVPAAAMFSHRIPADVRRSIRDQVGRLTAALTPPSSAEAGGRMAGGKESTSAEGPVVAAAVAVGPASGPAAPLVAAAETDGNDVSGRLARLGAIGFECRPIAGGGGEHMASCSVPLDGSGQLLRVFHVTGGDAHAAANCLLDDVVAWRDRAGLQRAAAEPARAGGQPLRF
ncbi:MAG: hypothetical protein WCO76_04050 [Planctomycetota bacterium]